MKKGLGKDNYSHRFSQAALCLFTILLLYSCGGGVKLQKEVPPLNTSTNNRIDVPYDINSIPGLEGLGNVHDLHQAMERDSTGQLKALVELFLATSDSSVRNVLMDQILFKLTVSNNSILELKGSGNVHDLHQAMEGDSTGQLKALVELFIETSDPSARNALMDQILFKWTGSDGIAANSRGAYIDARKLAVLEKFSGKQFTSDYGPNPVYELAIDLNDAYRKLFEKFYAKLMAKTHFKRFCWTISYTWDNTIKRHKQDMSFEIAAIKRDLANDPINGRSELGEFSRTLRGINFMYKYDYLSFREAFVSMDTELGWVIDSAGLPVYDNVHQGHWANSPHITGTDNADAIKGNLAVTDSFIIGYLGNDVIYGTTKDEILINESGDAIMIGGGGNDIIWAGADNDILDGGVGNDMLYGEAGSDIYVFRRGSGQDTIIDIATPGNIDTIWLGSNLTPSDVVVRRQSDDLVLRIKNTYDTLTVKDSFRNNSTLNLLGSVWFQDGILWTKQDIIDKIDSRPEGNDAICGTTGDDRLQGTRGNDILSGNAGNDSLNGSLGNDILYGGMGNDILFGGAGDDMLYGEAGNDIYLFGRGSGQDIIYDYDETPGNADIILMNSDIKPADVRARRNCDNIVLKIIETNDTLTISNFFTGDSGEYQIERIWFADDTVWDVDTIKQFVLQSTPDKISLSGYSSSDVIRGKNLDDFIGGGAGNDTLYGGNGRDYLSGNEGNDTIYGEADDDTLFGGPGHDILEGGTGNDILYGGIGNDILYGGAGDDMLYGEAGNDIYLFGRGSGQDIIYDYDKTPGNADIILINSDIKPADVSVRRDGEHLVLNINDTKDTLTISNFFTGDSGEYRIERIWFADDTVWDLAQ